MQNQGCTKGEGIGLSIRLDRYEISSFRNVMDAFFAVE